MSIFRQAVEWLTGAKKSSAKGGGENGEEIYETCPFMLLPEMMEMIFVNLGSSDLQTGLNTCWEWCNILEPKKNLFQWELVLPILLEEKILTLEDVLGCRFVCRKWKESTDFVLQNHPSRLNIPESSEAFALRVAWRVASTDFRPSSMRLFADFGLKMYGTIFNIFSRPRPAKTGREFVEDLITHPQNPFVGRSFNMRTYELSDYRTLGKPILDSFGAELRYFTWWIDDFAASVEEMLEAPMEERIRDALQLLPNIKWLQLDANLSIHDLDQASRSLLEARVSSYFQRQPLPMLEKLETFCCRNFPPTPTFILRCVLERCCPQDTLKRLDISHSQLKYQSTFSFPNLEELGIKTELKEMANLKRNSPRLKKLTLIVTNWEDWRYVDIDGERLFGILEEFQETLIDLAVGKDGAYKNVYSFRFNPGFEINLPNLKRFMMDCEVPPLESLKKLRAVTHLGMWSFSDEDPVEDYRIYAGRVLPNLKFFVCKGPRYPRYQMQMKRDLKSGEMVQKQLLDFDFRGIRIRL